MYNFEKCSMQILAAKHGFAKNSLIRGLGLSGRMGAENETEVVMEYSKLIVKVAEQEGVSPFEEEREMRLAIEAGLSSPDPVVREFWELIPWEGAVPTPRELIGFLAGVRI